MDDEEFQTRDDDTPLGTDDPPAEQPSDDDHLQDGADDAPEQPVATDQGDLVQRLMALNENLATQLSQRQQANEVPKKALVERLVARNIDEKTAAILADALDEFKGDLDQSYIPKAYEQVMATSFMDSRERRAEEVVADGMKLTTEEVKATRAEYKKVRDEYGAQVPIEMAYKLAAANVRMKTPRKAPAKPDPMSKPFNPPHRGSVPSGKTWEDYSDSDFNKLSWEQQHELLSRKRA